MHLRQCKTHTTIGVRHHIASVHSVPVAWNQPVSSAELTETGHSKPMAPIRQLIRLQLLEVERTGNRRTDVAYRTSQRFLKLFELESLEDLPQANLFTFK